MATLLRFADGFAEPSWRPERPPPVPAGHVFGIRVLTDRPAFQLTAPFGRWARLGSKRRLLACQTTRCSVDPLMHNRRASSGGARRASALGTSWPATVPVLPSKVPANGNLSTFRDGRGWFRTTGLSRVKHVFGRHPRDEIPANRAKPSRPYVPGVGPDTAQHGRVRPNEWPNGEPHPDLERRYVAPVTIGTATGAAGGRASRCRRAQRACSTAAADGVSLRVVDASLLRRMIAASPRRPITRRPVAA